MHHLNLATVRRLIVRRIQVAIGVAAHSFALVCLMHPHNTLWLVTLAGLLIGVGSGVLEARV